MQPVDERDQIEPRERQCAPFAARLHGAGRRVDGDLVEIDRIRLPRRRIGTRHHAGLQRMAGLDGERQIGHLHARVGRFDPLGERERRKRLPAAARDVEVAVQRRVELVIPGDQRAGEPRDEQKQRGREAEPSMQADEQRSHERIHRVHRGWRAGRIGRWPGRDGLRIMEATHTQRAFAAAAYGRGSPLARHRSVARVADGVTTRDILTQCK